MFKLLFYVFDMKFRYKPGRWDEVFRERWSSLKQRCSRLWVTKEQKGEILRAKWLYTGKGR